MPSRRIAMSVSIDQRASHVRSILAPAIVVALVVLLTFLAVEATETIRLSKIQEETLAAPHPLQGGGNIVYGEPIAMP
jgi:hypothetical protein